MFEALGILIVFVYMTGVFLFLQLMGLLGKIGMIIGF